MVKKIAFPGCKFQHLFILTFFFLSGISGLIYEVLWTRKLSLIFGSTTVAVSISLTVYLGGLALGAYLWGRARRPDAPRVIGLWFAGTGNWNIWGAEFLDSERCRANLRPSSRIMAPRRQTIPSPANCFGCSGPAPCYDPSGGGPCLS